jgi:hypothetical protein
MNLENFERVKAAILANPQSFHMSWFAAEDERFPCGTVGCIAGFCDWLMAVDGERGTAFRADGSLKRELSSNDPVKNRGRRFLGITHEQAELLFYADKWPRQFYSRHVTTFNWQRRAELTVERIDHFLATGE